MKKRARGSLAPYKEKRDFAKSPEPAGRVGDREGYSYVIQKHHATRLHYDFRLELGGVLKSWAVPKGPSLNPADKRLAAHVEDHPIEYGGFEGVIPKGQYGGGKVIVWDRGTWTPIGDPYEGYKKGRLKFELHGVKLHGYWNLVRMHGRGNEPDDKNWLLIKGHDEHAGTGDITVEQPDSVLSEQGPPRVWESKESGGPAKGERPPRKAAKPPKKSKSAKSALPEALEPQLATLVEAPPEGPDWLHEIKFDGYRLLCRIEGGEVRLVTRHAKDWTDRFPTLVRAARELDVRDALLDGELVALDERGISSFQAMQNALGGGREKDVVYYAFDLLQLDGRDLRALPLKERKELLAGLLKKSTGTLRYTEHVEGSGAEFYKHACKLSLEGMVSKKADAPYQSGRSLDWQKSKCLARQEFVIAGYTDPEGQRHGFGALILGVHAADGKLRYVGRVGTGFDGDTLSELRARLEKLGRKQSPFEVGTKLRTGKIHWVEPSLVAEVAFAGWTEDQIVRQARFEGLREDKPAAEVVVERPRKAAPAAPAAANQFAGVTLTHPEKVLYPGQGITKRDLAAYYESVADWILPHLVGRPLSIVRCPEGQGKECFYQKHAYEGTSKLLRRVRIPEGTGTGKASAAYLAVDGLPGLISLVQMGVLELHPWGSRVETLERPDRLTIDLDPAEDVPWKRMIETALALRSRFHDLGLESFVKTTGGKGLHVVVPLLPKQSWEDLKEFSRSIAEEFVRAAPHWFVATMTKSKRAGKIFLDFFRNTRGATSVAAYSTRSREGAPVSTPLTWDELPGIRSGNSHTIETVPARLGKLGADPWKGYSELRQWITPAMKRSLGVRRGKSG
ncbi:MAG: DNA ligase D [Planctomycetaceae bacterium]|nr:DNA ligase D [Planctomycetaceae bacterium]